MAKKLEATMELEVYGAVAIALNSSMSMSLPTPTWSVNGRKKVGWGLKEKQDEWNE